LPSFQPTCNFQRPEVPLGVMLFQVACNQLHAVLAAFAVRAAIGVPPRLDGFGNMASYILLAAVAATVVACVLAVSLFLLTGWTTNFWLAFRQRVLANIFPITTIPPLIVLSIAGQALGVQQVRRRDYAEFGMLMVGLLAVGILAFGWTSSGVATAPALLLAPLPFLLWAAVRFGVGGVSLSLVALAGISVAYAFVGRGPFAGLSAAENVYSLQIFLVAVSVPLMLLAAETGRRRTAELEVHQRMSELAHVNRQATAGELSASIAHELSQPLGAILSNAEAAELLLESRSPDLDEIKEIVADIRRNDQRASEIIRHLRDLLKKRTVEVHNVDLNEAVHEVVELLSAQASAHDIRLSEVMPPQMFRVSGDRVQLQQVVLNLIVNAIDALADAASAERTITIRTAMSGDASAEVSVADTGTGIPLDKLTQLFEPFFTTKERGMGMGLSIARKIIEAHGGRIWGENREGGGAVFHISLPLAKGQARDSR
jgi:signal transduction histidine kinase